MEGYQISEDDKTKIRETFDVTESEVKVRIKQLQKWAKDLPHLPQESQEEAFLEIMLLRGKFKDEFVKPNIENYFKCLGKHPDIFLKLGKFKPSEEVGVVVVSPKFTSNYERIVVLKLSPKNLATKKFDINQMILVVVTTALIMYNNDYLPSIRFVLDFEGISVFDVFKVNIRDMFKLVYITEKMLRIRISGFELINTPRILTAILAIAKVLLKPKMFMRITAHSDLSSVYDNIPKECLPSDYGGGSQSSENLIELWDHILETQHPFFEKIAILAKHQSEISKRKT
jgi:hypothetical protein